MNIKLQLPKLSSLRPRITVVGVGGAGSNAVNNMITSGLSGVNFVVANTDAQSLANSTAEHRIQLGAALTEGLGAGARPEIGKAAAEEAMDEIRAQVSGSHMVFVAGGMGGGTGTGAAAVIARIARECGALTVGVVTKPFQFEGTRRMRAAEIGISALKPEVDTLIVIPNENLFRIANERTTFADAFVLADQVLYSGIACVVDLIVKEGLINLDFADVRTVMSGMGTAMMGTGEAAGDRRAVIAAEEAISNPLLDDISLRGARGLLVSITGNRDLTLYEVDEAATRVRQEVDPEAVIIVGANFDDTMGDRIRVSIVASGMERLGEQSLNQGQNHGQALGTWQTTHAAPHTATDMPSPSYAVAPPPTDDGRQDRDHGQLSSLSSASAHAAEPGYGQPSPYQATDPAAATSPHGQYQQSRYQPDQHQPSARHVPQQADLTRAISEALGNHGPSAQGWASQSGAVFAEAPPQLSHAPSALDNGHGHQDHQHGAQQGGGGAHDFAPQAPVDHNQSYRRLPQVEDFPPVGQREYHAKIGQYGHSQAPSQVPPRAYAQPAPEQPPRKLGFFERLTGARRKAEAKPSDAPVHPQASGANEKQHLRGERSAHRGATDGTRGASPQPQEHNDLPVFFGGGRK